MFDVDSNLHVDLYSNQVMHCLSRHCTEYQSHRIQAFPHAVYAHSPLPGGFPQGSILQRCKIAELTTITLYLSCSYLKPGRREALQIKYFLLKYLFHPYKWCFIYWEEGDGASPTLTYLRRKNKFVWQYVYITCVSWLTVVPNLILKMDIKIIIEQYLVRCKYLF